MRASIGRRSWRLVIIAAALFAAVGGIAYATNAVSTQPLATNVIQGCENGGNGNLRVVANNQTDCHANETPISWNLVGPQGPQGPQGPRGAIGPAGPAGATGSAGANGTNGTNGTDGTDGTNGTNGTSVTSSPEAAGANCAHGGSSFTSVSGTTYACNGADGTSGSSLTKIEDLNGIACTDHSGHASTVVVSVAADGSLSLSCPTVATPPPPPPPGLGLSGDGSFGTAHPTSPPRFATFIFSNGGPAAVTIDAVEADDVFTVFSTTCGAQLAGGGATCQIVVSFDPAFGEGDYADMLTVRGPGYALTAALSGHVLPDTTCLRRLAKKGVNPCP